MPDYMRNEGGWYEEDCEWAKAAVVHPVGFQRVVNGRTEFDIAMETLRNWHPVPYERFTGAIIERGLSIVKDERLFKFENENNFVVTAAWGDWAHWVPKCEVGVVAKRDSDKAEKWVPSRRQALQRATLNRLKHFRRVTQKRRGIFSPL
ncbi:hypothetical protein ABIF91_001593 [Bradyrhizobium sp. USDA 241]